jgi:hypothetical protein
MSQNCVFGSVTTQLRKMKNLEFQQNTHLIAVYFNEGEPNLLKIHVDITLDNLKHKLTQLNGRRHSRDQRWVTDVEYRLSVCSDGTVVSTNMKLQNDADVRKIVSIFSQ